MQLSVVRRITYRAEATKRGHADRAADHPDACELLQRIDDSGLHQGLD